MRAAWGMRMMGGDVLVLRHAASAAGDPSRWPCWPDRQSAASAECKRLPVGLFQPRRAGSGLILDSSRSHVERSGDKDACIQITDTAWRGHCRALSTGLPSHGFGDSFLLFHFMVWSLEFCLCCTACVRIWEKDGFGASFLLKKKQSSG
jgi:hypothetical protein